MPIGDAHEADELPSSLNVSLVRAFFPDVVFFDMVNSKCRPLAGRLVLIGFPFWELQTSDLQPVHDAWIVAAAHSPGDVFIKTNKPSVCFTAQTENKCLSPIFHG
jgi:hypothetical protein